MMTRCPAPRPTSEQWPVFPLPAGAPAPARAKSQRCGRALVLPGELVRLGAGSETIHPQAMLSATMVFVVD